MSRSPDLPRVSLRRSWTAHSGEPSAEAVDEAGGDDNPCVAMDRSVYTFKPHTGGFRGRRSDARDVLLATGVHAFDAVDPDGNLVTVSKLCPVCGCMFGANWVRMLRHCRWCAGRARSGIQQTTCPERLVRQLEDAARSAADAHTLARLTSDLSGGNPAAIVLYSSTLKRLSQGRPFRDIVNDDSVEAVAHLLDVHLVPHADSAYVDRVLWDGERTARSLTIAKVRDAPTPFCALAMDGWTHTCNPHIKLHFLNFVVVVRSACGTARMYVWKVVDLGYATANSGTLADLVLEVIDDIHAKTGKVVSSLVTDGAANLKKTRQLVQEAKPSVFPRRCVAHALHLLVVDITCAAGTWSYGTLRTAQSVARLAEGTAGMARLVQDAKNWMRLHPQMAAGC